MKKSKNHFEENWQNVAEENQKISLETDQKIWQAIEYRIKRDKTNRKYYWVAAVLIPFFAILFFAKNNISLKKGFSEEKIYATQGVSKTFLLPDDTKVTLEPNSKLILDKEFGKEKRKVRFQGKGIFAVAKDKEKPFIVDASEFKVEVLGTKFLIDQNSGNQKVELYEGKVKIEHFRNLTFLLPQEIWNLNEKNIESHYYSTNKSTTFSFENRNYADVINILEETYQVNIKYPSLYKDKKINGSFTGNFEEVLSIVSYPFNLKADKISDTQIVLK